MLSKTGLRSYRNKLILFSGLLMLAVLLKTSVLSILFQSDKEIVYDYETIAYVCLKDLPLCTYIAQLKVANTGKHALENISIEIDNMPKALVSDIAYFNLIATEPRAHDPSVQIIKNQYRRQIRVDRLTPGTLIEIDFKGSIPVESKKELNDIDVALHAEANVIKANPRGTKLGRMLSGLLWM